MASPRTAIAVNAAPSWLVWIFRVNLIVQVGIVVTGGSAESALQRQATEMSKWAGVIKAGNLQLGG